MDETTSRESLLTTARCGAPSRHGCRRLRGTKSGRAKVNDMLHHRARPDNPREGAEGGHVRRILDDKFSKSML